MEDNSIVIDFSNEAYEERFELAAERILQFPEGVSGAAAAYFAGMKDLLSTLLKVRNSEISGREANALLYAELEASAYRSSFLNPDYAVEQLGECGQLLCVWYSEYRGIIPFLYENRIKDIAVILETTIQIFNTFEEKQRNSNESDANALGADASLNAELSDIVYSYIYDYAEEFVADYVKHDSDPSCSFAKDIVMNADLSNTGADSYLYRFGEWITQEELLTAELMASLPEDVVEKMAAAYTGGYIRGFAMTGKVIRRKSIVSCYLPLGFERFMRAAIRQFEAEGLQVVINRNPVHLINRKSSANIRPGFYGAFNRECDFDHKEDLALFWGDKLKSCKLRAMENAYEEEHANLGQHSGHACVEIFGLEGGAPEPKQHRPVFSKHQIDVNKKYAFKAHEIAQRFMPDEEISFTIVAWPTPSIAGAPSDYRESGDDAAAFAAFMAKYREIFDCFVEINTLPVDRWQQIQQALIDALDQADYIEVRGVEGNDTDIRVQLHTLKDPASETNFENCLADVNIPAGEVFTSPQLKGTNGTIHASYVYISGYLFRDLKITFADGRVESYSCANYADEERGKDLIRRVIFRNREELPLGEFAIGTNTAAYAAAERFGIASKMPVLIAEKTGPHFAVGDTCYSYEEDIVTCNPDGKKITARENECSALRNTEPEKAYFSVHTDITLPYDELLSIRAVGSGIDIPIIENGRFVLEGTEELNHALS